MINDYFDLVEYQLLGVSEDESLYTQADEYLPEAMELVIEYVAPKDSMPQVDLIEQVLADTLIAQAYKEGSSGSGAIFKSFVFNTARAMAATVLAFSATLLKRLAFWALNAARLVIYNLARVMFRFIITPLLKGLSALLFTPTGSIILGVSTAAAGAYLLYRALVHGESPSTVLNNVANNLLDMGGDVVEQLSNPILNYIDSNESELDASLKLGEVPASIIADFFIPSSLLGTSVAQTGTIVYHHPKPQVTPLGRSTAVTPDYMPTPSAGGELYSGHNAYKYLKFRNNATLEGMHPAMVKYFLAMVEEYGDKTGKTVYVNSGYRDRHKQAILHAQNPRKAAAPGRSLHEFGLALDVDRVYLNEMEKMGLLRKYGFTRPVGGEPWHLEPAGIQTDINRAKEDSEWAEQKIHESLGRGGGGYGTMSNAAKYRRNASVARAAYGVNEPTPNVPNNITATLPKPPKQSTLGTTASSLSPNSINTGVKGNSYAMVMGMAVEIPE